MELINILTGENGDFSGKFDKFYKSDRKFSLSIAKENLCDIVSVLNKFKITHWLMFGTLLGCVRGGNFIEYDTDIDIGCFRHQYKLIAEAIKELKDLGFELLRVCNENETVSIGRNGVYIDFYTFTERPNGAYTFQKYLLTRANFNLMEKDFLGFKVNILSDYENLLSKWYGEDWRIPRIDVKPKAT